MQNAAREVELLEKQLEDAKRRLENERTAIQDQMMTCDVQQYLKEMEYDKANSGNIVASGDFGSFTSWSKEYNIGTAQLPMHIFQRARGPLDFSTVFIDIWDPKYKEANIFLTVGKCLENKWDFIQQHDLFLLPIDLNKKQRGYKKCDLPNVTFALTVHMLKRNIEFVVVDPIYKGTDSFVNIVNFSHVLRSLQDSKCRVSTAIHATSDVPSGGWRGVFYQRGSGVPDKDTSLAITAATGLFDQTINVKLTVGKYDKGGRPSWTTCYSEFKHSNSLILHQHSVIDEFISKKRLRTLNRVYYVLDEFSAYAAYTAVAILGYGLEHAAYVLCYFKGEYTPMPVFTAS